MLIIVINKFGTIWIANVVIIVTKFVYNKTKTQCRVCFVVDDNQANTFFRGKEIITIILRNLLILYKLARYCYHLFGNEFRNKSFVFPFNFSGKTISKEISMSPFLEGSLERGRPFPAIRFTVVGFTISSYRLTTNRSPFSVGTSTRVPHNAWNTTRALVNLILQATK